MCSENTNSGYTQDILSVFFMLLWYKREVKTVRDERGWVQAVVCYYLEHAVAQSQ